MATEGLDCKNCMGGRCDNLIRQAAEFMNRDKATPDFGLPEGNCFTDELQEDIEGSWQRVHQEIDDKFSRSLMERLAAMLCDHALSNRPALVGAKMAEIRSRERSESAT